jgi:hypothetical protein
LSLPGFAPVAAPEATQPATAPEQTSAAKTIFSLVNADEGLGALSLYWDLSVK